MVSGFPVPMSPSLQSPTRGGAATVSSRWTRPKAYAQARSAVTVKRGKNHEHEGSDDDETAVDHGGGGLGLTPATHDSDERVLVPVKREDIRKARIESEQRRRDELREGFTLLKETLPPTNQRASKASLLDRSVAHIQQIESANRYLLNQLESANREIEKLRASNAELVHALSQSRAESI